jgi:hypothetical protein
VVSNHERIGILYDTAGPLVRVRYALFNHDIGEVGDDWITAIELTFEGVVASIYAEGALDTVRLELETMTVLDRCRTIPAVSPWSRAIGGSLTWIWLLRNQQGYEDGLRFQFSTSGSAVDIALIVIGSGLRVYESRVIRAHE